MAELGGELEASDTGVLASSLRRRREAGMQDPGAGRQRLGLLVAERLWIFEAAMAVS